MMFKFGLGTNVGFDCGTALIYDLDKPQVFTCCQV